jgi:sphingomyelin phosphodiesterase 2
MYVHNSSLPREENLDLNIIAPTALSTPGSFPNLPYNLQRWADTSYACVHIHICLPSEKHNRTQQIGHIHTQLGDFNSVPTTLPMTIIRDHAGLTDGWFASHPELAQDPPEHTPDAASALHLFGVTADSPLNSYSAGKWLDDHARQFAGKRLDYVLYRQPAPSARGHARSDAVGGNGRAPALRCIQSAVVFTENVPRRSFSYSDHFGLEATFEVVANAGKRSSAAPPSPWAEDIEGGTGDGADSVSLADVPSDEVLPPSYLTHASLATVIEALTTCYKLSQARSHKYLWLFGGSILLLLGMIVGSAWLPRSWANPVFILLAVVVAWFGTTMLYVGFIYGRWEVNALLNVIEELEIHRSTIVR